MTKEEALAKLLDIKAGENDRNSPYFSPDTSHRDADNVLCNLLETLVCADVVQAFRDVFKWYA